MTPHQETALDQALANLGHAFPNFVLAVDNGDKDIRVMSKGGYASRLGLSMLLADTLDEEVQGTTDLSPGAEDDEDD